MTKPKPTCILTVDDSASMRMLLLHALTQLGYEVAQAEDGQAALEWIAHNHADAVITDINMPRLDGFGLIEKLREDPCHVDRPILVLTTECSQQKQERARSSGANGWIVKPFNPENLQKALRRVVH